MLTWTLSRLQRRSLRAEGSAGDIMGITMRIRAAHACDLWQWNGGTHRDEAGPIALMDEDIFSYDCLNLKEWKTLFESNNHKIIVAEHLKIPMFMSSNHITRKILGYAIFEHVPPKNPALLHIAVARDERRKGIATALVKEMKLQLGVKNEIITVIAPLHTVMVPFLMLLTRRLGFVVKKSHNNMIKLATNPSFGAIRSQV